MVEAEGELVDVLRSKCDLELFERKSGQNDVNVSHELVLEFWFSSKVGTEDGGSAGNRFAWPRKRRWFVADCDDRDVVDNLITERFGDLLEDAKSGLLDTAWGMGSARQVLALVVVLDQFSRHVYRGHAEIIKKCTLKAVKHTCYALKRGLDSHLLPAHVSFLLMPLRHFVGMELTTSSDNLLTKREAIEILESKIQECFQRTMDHVDVFDGFAKATDRRTMLGLGVNDPSGSKTCTFADRDLLDPNCTNVDLNANLLSKLPSTDIYRELLAFLTTRISSGLDVVNLYVSLSGGVDSMVIAFILSQIMHNRHFSNSMPASSSLNSALRRKKKRSNSNICPAAAILNHPATRSSLDSPRIVVNAIHIDYGNREESNAEALFVKKWCELCGIKFYCRRMEFRRASTDRDAYEKLSRAVRFEAYKDCIRSSGVKDFENDRAIGIMVGHHKGDIQENVISNIMKGCSVMEISGMGPESKIDHVRIWRPLLQFDKKDILNLAHRFGVPYFKDSTPRWSTRGKLRNQLLPAIGATYGNGFRRNLSAVATQSDELNSFMMENFMQPFLDRVEYGKMAVLVPLDGYIDQPALFYKFALTHICHTIKTGGVKDGAISTLTEALQSRRFVPKNTKSTGPNPMNNLYWMVLKPSQPTFIFSDERPILILLNRRYGWRDSILEVVNDEPLRQVSFDALNEPSEKKLEKVPINSEKLEIGRVYRVGCYEISIALSECEPSKSKFDLLDWLLTGIIRYTMPKNPHGYRLCPKSGRDVAFFKAVDRRLRETIPIVSSEVQKDTMTSFDGSVQVRISLCASLTH